MSTPLISPTVQETLQSVRRLLSQPNAENSTWSDSDLLAYINEGVRRYFTELAKVNEGYFMTATTLNITSGTEEISLPSDFFQMRAVYKLVGSDYVILPYRNNFTEGYTTTGGSSSSAYLPYYFFRNNKIVLRPTPQFTETAGLRIEYFAYPETLINGADSMTSGISPIFKSVVEMYAVYKAKFQESLVTGLATYKVAEDNLVVLEKQLKEASQFRSRNPTFVIPYNPEIF